MSNDTPLPTASVARQASAREFFAVVFRRKWIIVGLFLVTTATVLVMALSTPLVYSSVGRVLIRRGEAQSLLYPYRNLPPWEEELASEVEVVKSYPVQQSTQAILDQRAQAGGSRRKIQIRQVDVEVVGQSNVVLIAYADRDPQVAQEVCDALIQAYVEHRLKTLNLSYPQQFFNAEIERVTHELSRWETLRRDFTSQSGLQDPGGQRNEALAVLTSLQQNQSEVAANLAEARATQKAMLQLQNNNSDVDVPATTLGFLNEMVLVDLKRKVVDLEAKLADLRGRYRDDSPEVQRTQTTLETLRGMLRREVDSRLTLSQAKIDALESRLGSINKDIARVETELGAIPAKQMRLDEIEREIDVLKKRYQDLMSNSDQARVTQQTTPRLNIMVLAPAGVATPRNSRDYVRLALAPAFSLVVGLGLAFFLDGLDPRMRTASDVESALELPVLASVTERRRRRPA